MPSPPDIPGIDDYQGIKFHSARWRHDVDLSHKRVAVFGLGSSASVLISLAPLLVTHTRAMIRNKTTQMTHFIRTPAWFVSRYNSPVPEHYKWIFRNIPGSLRLYRNYLYAVAYQIGPVLRAIPMIFKSDVRYLAWVDWGASSRARAEKVYSCIIRLMNRLTTRSGILKTYLFDRSRKVS